MTERADMLPDGRLRLDVEAALPDPLDVLVAGGGPAGTAVAFRAKELGVSALVIELDDILKRIRDYDRNKPIKPDFGAGRQMGFPKGGALVEQLHFFTDVGGGELCDRWKALYRRHGVPAQVGVELLGLEPEGEDVWRAQVRNHRTGSDGVLRARHVVLALGAGEPRRLDIPGDVRAVANRLAGADRYVGGPACVIGGGVSAAEAVIAISGAKTAAADETPVYWSHRGDKMPSPPQALKEALEQAASVNGNVRFLPGSEAREIVETDRGRVLRLRIGPRDAGDAAAGEAAMGFDAARVIAWIGQEIDWKLMNGIGIFQVSGGSHVRKAIPLNALLECRQPNVYVIGDTLNPSYLECGDFDGDVAGFEKKPHRGNIKASLIDGVKVANVIAQRLAGKSDIRIDLEFVGGAAPAAVPSGGPPPAVLTQLIDGAVEAERFALHAGRVTTIGRRDSDVCFADDSRVADRHAAVVPGRDGYRLRDEGSPDGVFLHLTEGREHVVAPGAIARIGRQWLVFGSARDPLLLAHHDARGRLVRRYRLSAGTQVVGRNAPDITLAVDDGSLSRRHAAVVVLDKGVFLRDLNSMNGSYLKVDGSCALTDGDVMRIGHQALRFQLARAEPRSEVRAHANPPGVVRAPAKGPAASADALAVTFGNRGGASCPFRKGQTICEVAEGSGVAITADCHAGICGSDPVQVVSGRANLNPMSGAERETLEEICGVAPDAHRLACMTRPAGPVTVEIVDG